MEMLQQRDWIIDLEKIAKNAKAVDNVATKIIALQVRLQVIYQMHQFKPFNEIGAKLFGIAVREKEAEILTQARVSRQKFDFV